MRLAFSFIFLLSCNPFPYIPAATTLRGIRALTPSSSNAAALAVAAAALRGATPNLVGAGLNSVAFQASTNPAALMAGAYNPAAAFYLAAASGADPNAANFLANALSGGAGGGVNHSGLQLTMPQAHLFAATLVRF